MGASRNTSFPVRSSGARPVPRYSLMRCRESSRQKPLQVAPARFGRHSNATAAAKLIAGRSGLEPPAGVCGIYAMCVSVSGYGLGFSSALERDRRGERRFSKKACAMMASRETKLHFALPDAALPPIHSPEKIVVRGSVCRCDCVRLRCCVSWRVPSHWRYVGRSDDKTTDERRDGVASGLE